MYSATSQGLEMFQNVGKLEALGLLEGCQTGKFPDRLPEITCGDEPEVLTFATDQEQTQVTGGEFVLTCEPEGLGCTGVRFADEFHRMVNDLEMAVAKAGLAPAEKAGTLVFNIGYGPWQKAAFFHKICAQGNAVAKKLKPNGNMVLKFWRRRLVDTGKQNESADDIVGSAARSQWIAGIPEQNHMNLKGTKVAPSTWMSFQKAGAEWSPVLATRALVLSSLCLDMGWVLTDEDLFSSTRCGANDCGDKPAPKSKAEAHRHAKARLEALKNRTQNTIVAATKLLCDDDVVNGIRVILHGSKALWRCFGEVVCELTSPDQALQHHVRMSQQWWMGCLRETAVCLTDITGLSRCGFHTDFKVEAVRKLTIASAQVRYQDALALRLGRFVDLMVETLGGSWVLRSGYYPFKLAGLCSSDAAVRQKTMGEFKLDCDALWAAKDTVM
jgi:hypothetical protein